MGAAPCSQRQWEAWTLMHESGQIAGFAGTPSKATTMSQAELFPFLPESWGLHPFRLEHRVQTWGQAYSFKKCSSSLHFSCVFLWDGPVVGVTTAKIAIDWIHQGLQAGLQIPSPMRFSCVFPWFGCSADGLGQ